MIDPNAEITDAGKRASEVIRLHILAGKAGRWAAIRLSDGGSDGIAYDQRSDAIRHQLHESQCAYVKIPQDDMSPAAASSFITVNRRLYDAGYRLTDPDDDREIVLSYQRKA